MHLTSARVRDDERVAEQPRGALDRRESNARLEGLDSLRAVAALAVTWYHFTHGGHLLDDGPLKSSGKFGWVGAHVFFVISGFVIPYALERSGYETRLFGRFFGRRVLRLMPPYVASLFLVLALWLLSSLAPGFRGAAFAPNIGHIVAHFLYLNDWLGIRWANPVYWTLAIEMQFYLLIGLAFPLLSSGRAWLRWTALSLLSLGSVVADYRLVLGFGAFFALGFATFLRHRGRIGLLEYAVHGAVACSCLWASGNPERLVHIVAGIAASGAILITNTRIPGLDWVGRISYSLYLLHVPIGGRVINLGERLDDSLWIHMIVLAAAVLVSVVAAGIFYRMVELPSHGIAKRFVYTADSRTLDVATQQP